VTPATVTRYALSLSTKTTVVVSDEIPITWHLALIVY